MLIRFKHAMANLPIRLFDELKHACSTTIFSRYFKHVTHDAITASQLRHLTSILEGCHMFGEGMELSKLHLVNDFRGVSSTCKEIRTGRRDTCRCSNNFQPTPHREWHHFE